MPSRRAARLILVAGLVMVGLVEAVRAQVSEAVSTAATAGRVADNFLSRGDYGALVVALGLVIIVVSRVSGLVIRFLYKEVQARNVKLEEIAERAVSALGAVAAAADRDREVLQELRASLDARTQTLGELSSLVSLNGQRIDHGFVQISQLMTTLAERMREWREDFRSFFSGRRP